MAAKGDKTKTGGKTARRKAAPGKAAPAPSKTSKLERDLKRLGKTGELRNAIDLALKAQQPPGKDVDQICQKLFAELRERCPDLIPGAPLKVGETGPALALGPKTVDVLFKAAARKVSEDQSRIVWYLGDNELMVLAADVTVETRAGRILVEIPVRCEETGPVTIAVPFAVGSPKHPGALFAVAPNRPVGPPQITELWADALTAFAWGILLELVQTLAAQSGVDTDRKGLIPVGLVADDAGLHLTTMARHAFDRGLP